MSAESSSQRESPGPNVQFDGPRPANSAVFEYEKLIIEDIEVEDRIRKDLGNLDELTASIREFGLIQPIVLARPNAGAKAKLIAGGRRITALKRAGFSVLRHGKEFVWRDEQQDGSENIKLRFQAIELEENLKRKELTWQEAVLGKQRLLETMQRIHGVAAPGGRTRAERSSGESKGFGVRKLAEMLGESPATVSKDLTVAGAISKFPALRISDTKESALRRLNIMSAVTQMSFATTVQRPNVPGEQPQEPPKEWTLYEGDFTELAKNIPDGTVDLVYTDLPFGVNLGSMSKHSTGVVSYGDDRDSVVSKLGLLANETCRVLVPDRYAVFFFGFNYYSELIRALKDAGLGLSPVPIVWYKHTRSTENPNTRYANAYDPAILCWKGSPCFIRPGQTNVVDIPALTAGDKLQVAQQPIPLVKRFIEDTTSAGATVVDFCAGTGTTGVAALQTNRKAILFEKDAVQWTIIKARMNSKT